MVPYNINIFHSNVMLVWSNLPVAWNIS